MKRKSLVLAVIAALAGGVQFAVAEGDNGSAVSVNANISVKDMAKILKDKAPPQEDGKMPANAEAAIVSAFAGSKVAPEVIIAAVKEAYGATATTQAAQVLMNAGANPVSVTVATIASGGNTAAVVDMAAKKGADPTVIRAAAISAGGDPTVILPATAAGSPSSQGNGNQANNQTNTTQSRGPAAQQAFNNAPGPATSAPGFTGFTPVGSPVPGGGGGGRPASRS